jgi:hypothetical protein
LNSEFGGKIVWLKEISYIYNFILCSNTKKREKEREREEGRKEGRKKEEKEREGADRKPVFLI